MVKKTFSQATHTPARKDFRICATTENFVYWNLRIVRLIRGDDSGGIVTRDEEQVQSPCSSRKKFLQQNKRVQDARALLIYWLGDLPATMEISRSPESNINPVSASRILNSKMAGAESLPGSAIRKSNELAVSSAPITF